MDHVRHLRLPLRQASTPCWFHTSEPLSHTVQSGDEDVRTKPLIGLIMSFSILYLVLSSLLLRAQDPLPPNPDFVDTVWVAHSDGIRKVSATDGTVLLTIADAQNVRAIAVDAQYGVLWAYRSNTVWAYSFNGKVLVSIPLGQQGDNGDGQDPILGVNPNNSTVWLGLKKYLYHFSTQGKWLSVHTLPGDVRALSWDATTSCLWVGTKESVSAIDDTGAMCSTRDVGSHPDVQDLAVDAPSGDLWVGMKKALQRYDADGALMVDIDLDKLAYLASDHRGGVWIATDRDLFRIDRFGQMLVATAPFDDHDKIVALATDPTDASVWVAGKSELSHLR